ncbi:MAG: GNAT family N-acetyltransferase [Candidatus Izemoplasmataceae bacterium]
MIIRYAKPYDSMGCTAYVYRRNLKDTFYSGYMPLQHHSIRKELNQAIKNSQMLIAETRNLIQGILVYGKYDELSQAYDIAGPYVDSENVSLAVEMLEFMKNDLDEVLDFNFFFKENSSFYKKLMKRIGATYNNHEYILRLKKENFNPLMHDDISVRKMLDSDASLIQSMHEDMFQNVYISSEMVIKSKEAYLINLLDKTIGYAVVRNQQDRIYLELFGITKEYRNKGFGRKALSRILEHTFNETSKTVCDLVVEAENRQATKVYKDAGFEEISANLSYTLKA